MGIYSLNPLIKKFAVYTATLFIVVTSITGIIPPLFAEDTVTDENKKNGRYDSTYSNGNKKLEITYKDGKENGPYVFWSETGVKLKEGNYKNGQVDGHWIRRYENGNIKDEGTWDNGIPEGHWSTYFENGNVKESGEWRCGEKVGVWKQGNQDGSLAEDYQYPLDFSCSPLESPISIRVSEWVTGQSGNVAATPYFSLLTQLYSFSVFNLRIMAGGGSFQNLNANQRSIVLDFLGGLEIRPFGRGLRFELAAGSLFWINRGSSFESLLGISSPPFGHGIIPFHGWLDLSLSYVVGFLPAGVSQGVRLGPTFHF